MRLGKILYEPLLSEPLFPKKETGFPVLQYVTNQKIIAAKALLKKGYFGHGCGAELSYNSDSHFYLGV